MVSNKTFFIMSFRLSFTIDSILKIFLIKLEKLLIMKLAR